MARNKNPKREGETSRTSNQGRKLASGNDRTKQRGNREVDDQTNSEKESKPRMRRS